VTEFVNTRVVLASFPVGLPTQGNFRIETCSVPPLRNGEVLVRTRYVSIDAHMRSHQSENALAAPTLSIGDVIEADATAEVLASDDPRYQPGQILLAKAGWQTHAILPANELRGLTLSDIPEATALALLGTAAFTAYSGLAQIGSLKAGETLVVPAALSATGAMVGQLGRIAGAWTVGIVTGSDECAFAQTQLGFSSVVDHTRLDFAHSLAESCPDGIDVFFETIGGALWHVIRPMLNDRARVVLSGTEAQYNHRFGGASQYLDPSTFKWMIDKGGTIGAVHLASKNFAEFAATIGEGLRRRSIWHRIQLLVGLEKAPEAWLTAIDGPDYGTRVIQVVQDVADAADRNVRLRDLADSPS
jgi:NADPH-dependent curcumin reductase